MSVQYPSGSLARVALFGAVGLACLTAACSKKAGGGDTTGASATAAPAPAATTTPANSTATAAPANSTATAGGAATLNDAQIAHVAVTANSIDSAAGVLAKQKGTSKAVKDFAQTMITDHTGVNKQAVALAKKLNVTPQDNPVSQQLKSGADQNMSNLQGKTGADFDSTYIDHEVTYHQAVLDALDKTLIPQAQNAELKAFLQKIRPVVAAHLDRAKKIQADLGKKTTS
jgi:putative membrane protein